MDFVHSLLLTITFLFYLYIQHFNQPPWKLNIYATCTTFGNENIFRRYLNICQIYVRYILANIYIKYMWNIFYALWNLSYIYFFHVGTVTFKFTLVHYLLHKNYVIFFCKKTKERRFFHKNLFINENESNGTLFFPLATLADPKTLLFSHLQVICESHIGRGQHSESHYKIFLWKSLKISGNRCETLEFLWIYLTFRTFQWVRLLWIRKSRTYRKTSYFLSIFS